MNTSAALICCRVGDPTWRRIEGSTTSPCNRCGHAVNVSPASRRRLQADDVIICVECAAEIAEARGLPWIDPGRNDEQLAELAANGHTPNRYFVNE